MRCSKCGRDNREGRKFCTSCGTALVASCLRCSVPIQPDESFCGECGAPLQAAASRRAPEASALMMRDLDPEEARAVIDPVLQFMMDAVHRFDGYGAPRRRGKEARMGP